MIKNNPCCEIRNSPTHWWNYMISLWEWLKKKVVGTWFFFYNRSDVQQTTTSTKFHQTQLCWPWSALAAVSWPELIAAILDNTHNSTRITAALHFWNMCLVYFWQNPLRIAQRRQRLTGSQTQESEEESGHFFPPLKLSGSVCSCVEDVTKCSSVRCNQGVICKTHTETCL